MLTMPEPKNNYIRKKYSSFTSPHTPDYLYYYSCGGFKLRDIRVLVYYPSQFLIKTMKG